MVKRPPSQLPPFVRTLADIIERGEPIAVSCSRCRGWRELDQAALIALAARVGADFSLVDRRCRCRLKPGCNGWNSFHYFLGVYRPLRSTERALHWLLRS